MLEALKSRFGDAKAAIALMAMLLGGVIQEIVAGTQESMFDLAGVDARVRTPTAQQLGIFMVLVFGAVALVVVSIVLLFGMDIAGEFADGINVDNEYSDAANDTVNSTGNAFQLFGTSVLVIPAAAVLAVLIGGLIGAVTMVGGGGALPGTRGGMGGR